MSTRIPLLMLLLVECINASPIQAPFVSSPPLMIAGYYACWTASVFPPESVNFTKLDWVDFAFAIPNENQEIGWEDDNHSQVLHRLVRAAHVQGTKVKLTRHFSKSVSTNSTRHTFASNLVKLYKLYNLDGIDIDWEYPGREGQPGNVYNPRDSFHLLEFLHVLRGLLPSDARISAAVQTVPFVDQNGNSMSDVSEFANVLDWAMVMNYDVWGASSTPGPNAPLSDNCKNSTQPEASAEAAVSSWTTAGFPVNQLVLGLPSYGYLSTSDVSHRFSFVNWSFKVHLSAVRAPQRDPRCLSVQGGLSDPGTDVLVHRC